MAQDAYNRYGFCSEAAARGEAMMVLYHEFGVLRNLHREGKTIYLMEYTSERPCIIVNRHRFLQLWRDSGAEDQRYRPAEERGIAFATYLHRMGHDAVIITRQALADESRERPEQDFDAFSIIGSAKTFILDRKIARLIGAIGDEPHSRERARQYLGEARGLLEAVRARLELAERELGP